MNRGDCFYARFQDDIILVSRKRHLLKRMRKEMYEILKLLQLSLRYKKTYVGRSQKGSPKGFDLLGYHITLQRVSPSQKNQENALENAKRRYAQGGTKSLQLYLNCWRTWGHAGLPFKVHHVENVVASLAEKVTALRRQPDSQSATPRPTLSVFYGLKDIMKGIPPCKTNFSSHQD